MKLCYESVYIVFNLVASNRSGGNLLYDSTFRVNKRHYRRYIFIRLVWTRNRSIFPIVKSNAFTNFENVETRLKIAPIQNRWIFEAKERREKKRAAITRSISSPFNDSFSISFSLEKKISRFSKFTSRNVFYPSPSIKQLLRKKKRSIVILPRFLQTIYKSFSNRSYRHVIIKRNYMNFSFYESSSSSSSIRKVQSFNVSSNRSKLV